MCELLPLATMPKTDLGVLAMNVMRWLETGRLVRPRVALLLLVAIGLAACDPTIFKKPAQDLVAELRTLRDGYFGLLTLRREAQYERILTVQRVANWAHPLSPSDPSYKDTVKAEQAQLDAAGKRAPLPENDLQVRQRAFDVLDSYAGTILALASNDDTEAIGAELSGLGGDLKALADVAKNVNVLKGAGEAVESWLPTISGLLGAVNKIIDIISAVVRTNAIRDVVHAAHVPIQKLLGILGDEAKVARADALGEFDRSIKEIDKSLTAGIANAVDARAALEYRASLKARRDALNDAPELSAAFAEASVLQDKLLLSVTKPDPKELARQALLFRQKVRDAKAALDAIH
jgi:hypothetical protein